MTTDEKTANGATGQTAIVKRAPSGLGFGAHGVQITTFDDAWRLATAISRTRVKGAETADIVFMKVQYGAELGMPPMASVVNVYVVDGKPSLGATSVLARIKATGAYNVRVKRTPRKDGGFDLALTNDECVLEFVVRVGTNDLKARNPYSDEWEWVGESRFDQNDAKKAGLIGKDNHSKYPRNMMFHRAITNGARWFCPEVFFGTVYTPEELGARVDDNGDVLTLDGNTGDEVPPPKAARSAVAEVGRAVNAPPERAPDPPKVADAEVIDEGAVVLAGNIPDAFEEPKPEPAAEPVYLALVKQSGQGKAFAELARHDVVWATTAKGEPEINDAFDKACALAEKSAKARAKKYGETFGEAGYIGIRVLTKAEATALAARPIEAAAPLSPTQASLPVVSSDPSPAASTETPPSYASPDGATAGPPASKTSALGDALKAMPKEAAEVVRYVTTQQKKLSAEDYFRLQQFGRARWNVSRKTPADTGLDEAKKKALAEAIAAAPEGCVP